jgi:hypothetical protein
VNVRAVPEVVNAAAPESLVIVTVWLLFDTAPVKLGPEETFTAV